MTYLREETPFVSTILHLAAGTHQVTGRPAQSALPTRNNGDLFHTIAEVFAPMVDDFEQARPMSAYERTSFINSILAHVVETGRMSRKAIQGLEPDSARLGMLFHFKPKLITSGYSIRELLHIHARLLAEVGKAEPWVHRPLLATFQNFYHLEELTERHHFQQEGAACGHCIAEMVRVWTLDPAERKNLRYGELAYHRLARDGRTRFLSFGDRTGPLTTIQFNTHDMREYAMLGPKFATAHTGRERYFHGLVDALAWFAHRHGTVHVLESHSISRVLIDALLKHPVGRRHVRMHDSSAILQELHRRIQQGLIG